MDKDNQREDVKLAYIAGLIDGEGTISLNKQTEKAHPQWNPKYTPYIGFTNTNLEALELVGDFLGSNVRHHVGSKDGFKGNKECFRVVKNGKNNVRKLLEKLLPYLVIKKKQAELVINYCDNFVASSGVGRGVRNGRFTGGRKIDPCESNRRELLFQELKKIHHPHRLNEKTPKGEATVKTHG